MICISLFCQRSSTFSYRSWKAYLLTQTFPIHLEGFWSWRIELASHLPQLPYFQASLSLEVNNAISALYKIYRIVSVWSWIFIFDQSNYLWLISALVYYSIAFFFLWNWVSHISGWPHTCYIVEDDLELLTLLLSSPSTRITSIWHHTCLYVVLGMDPRAVCKLGHTVQLKSSCWGKALDLVSFKKAMIAFLPLGLCFTFTECVSLYLYRCVHWTSFFLMCL